MKPELARTRRRVERIAQEVEHELSLEWIKFEHAFNEAEVDDACAAQCRANWEYRQATVEWNLPHLAPLSDDDIRDVATHEYLHALIDPLVSLLSEDQRKDSVVEKLVEYVTESVARVVASVRTARG